MTFRSLNKLGNHLRKGDRWLALVAGMWIMACGGLSFTFAIYSPIIKTVLSYDQSQIQALAVAKDIGESVGIIAGLTSDLLPSWTILTIGALHNFIGFGGFWLVLSGYIPQLPFWQMSLLLLIGSQGASYFNTVNLVTNVRNFPKSRGSVVGILKGLVGLSGAIFTQLYTAFMAPDQQGFLFVVAIVPLGVVAITAPFTKAYSAEDRKETPEEESSLLNIVIGICFTLAAYLLATMIFQDLLEPSSSVSKVMAAGMIALVILPLTAPVLSYLAPEKSFMDAPYSAITSKPLDAGNGVRSSSSWRPRPIPVSTNAGGSTEQQSPSDDLTSSPLVSPSPSRFSYLNSSNPSLASSPNIYQPQSWGSRMGQSGVSKPPLHPSSRLPSTFANSPAVPASARRSAPLPIPSANSASSAFSSPSSSLAASPGFGSSLGGYASDDILSADERQRNREVAASNWTAGSSAAAPPAPSSRSTPRAQLVQAVGEGTVGFLTHQRKRRGPRRGENFTLSEALVKADFWLLFLTFFCGFGAGLAAINNLAQMGSAQGFSDVGVFVSMVSVWNFCGRLGAGYLSEMLIKEYCLPRMMVLLISQALMAVGHLLLALALPGSLYIGSLIVGLCYGAHWAIMPATASELFGLKHFGMIYNVLAIANPLGSYICSDLIAAYFYEAESNGGAGPLGNFLQQFYVSVKGSSLEQLTPARALLETGDSDCIGAHCFRNTFLIMMGFCLLGVLVDLILVGRTKSVYLSLYGRPADQNKPESSEDRQ